MQVINTIYYSSNQWKHSILLTLNNQLIQLPFPVPISVYYILNV